MPTNVEFNEEDAFRREVEQHRAPSSTVSKLTGLIVRLGLAKDAAGANSVLIGILILAVISILLILFVT